VGLEALLLINAALGEISRIFADLEVIGTNPFDFEVVYDQESGDILLQNRTSDPVTLLDDATLPGGPPELDAARVAYIHDVLDTWVGDSNLHSEFNSGDFVSVFTTGEFEDASCEIQAGQLATGMAIGSSIQVTSLPHSPKADTRNEYDLR